MRVAPMKHRPLKLIACALAFGLLATWAIAWTSVFLAQPERLDRLYHDTGLARNRLVVQFSCFAARRARLAVETDQSGLDARLQILGYRARFAPALITPGSLYDRSFPHVTPSGDISPLQVVETRGWPWPAFRCSISYHPDEFAQIQADAAGRSTTIYPEPSDNTPVFPGLQALAEPVQRFALAGGFELATSRAAINPYTGTLVLPYVPCWPGLLADVALFAAALALPVAGWITLRSACRIRRGRCARCAYDLRADLATGCPECGWRRQPVTRVQDAGSES
jgi:hypothetical protein